MKILRLDLRAFGPFTDVELDLSGGREGLHLIYGPNEAGKSSALRALRQLLFGIDQQTRDRFVHEYARLRVGGTLRRNSGDELAFLRRKGNKKVLRTPDDAADLDDDALDPYLAGIDLVRYETLFSLDHDRLVSGGEDILKGKGDVGTLVFGAGTDLSRLLKLRSKLEADAASLFRPRGEIYPLNRSLSQFQEARKAISEALIRSEEWVEHRRLLDEAEAEGERIDGELDDLRRQKSRLERIHQALPDVAQRRDLIALLADLKDTPRLPDGFSEERRAAEQSLRDAERTFRDADEEGARLTAELAEIPAPGPILAESGLIESLKSRHDAHQNEAETIGRLRGECSALEAEAQSLRISLGLDDEPTEIDRLRVTVQQRERVRSLANDWHALVSEGLALDRTLHQQTLDRDRLTAALDALEAPRDDGPLRRALQETRSRGRAVARVRGGVARPGPARTPGLQRAEEAGALVGNPGGVGDGRGSRRRGDRGPPRGDGGGRASGRRCGESGPRGRREVAGRRGRHRRPQAWSRHSE